MCVCVCVCVFVLGRGMFSHNLYDVIVCSMSLLLSYYKLYSFYMFLNW